MTSQYERWTLKTSGITAEIFTEGQGAGTPGSQGYTELYDDAVYFWAWPRISGHSRDVVAVGGGKPGLNPVENEIMAGFDDIRDLLNTTFLGSTYGLSFIIDDANTVHGVDQSAQSWHQAAVDNVNGALTRAAFIDIEEELKEGNGKTSLYLGPNNQISNYMYLTGEPNAQNSSVRVNLGTMGGTNLDLVPQSCSVAGKPFVGIKDVADTEVYGLDLRRTRLGPNWVMKVMRPFDVRPKYGPQMVGDDDLIELSCAKLLVCRLVQRNSKLEGINA